MPPQLDILLKLYANGLIDKQLLQENASITIDNPLEALRSAFSNNEAEQLIEHTHKKRIAFAKNYHEQWSVDSTRTLPQGLSDFPTIQKLSSRLLKTPLHALLQRDYQFALKQTQCPSAVESVRRIARDAWNSLSKHQHSSRFLRSQLEQLNNWPNALREKIWNLIPKPNPDEKIPKLRSAQDPDRLANLYAIANSPLIDDIYTLCDEQISDDEQRNLCCLWTCRFGHASRNWADWKSWIKAQYMLQHQKPNDAASIICLFLIQKQEDALLLECLDIINKNMDPISAEAFAMRHANSLNPVDWRFLMGETETDTSEDSEDPQPEQPVIESVESEQSEIVKSQLQQQESINTIQTSKDNKEDVQEADASTTSKPKWILHLKQFIDEHLFILAGALMMLCGTPILTYYAWDEHWLVRYTLLPGLLAGLTCALGFLASWLEKRDQSLINTVTILRGIAVCLLPTNALVPALIAHDVLIDQNESIHMLALPISFLLYGCAIILALRRWCVKTDKSLSSAVFYALLANSTLVIITPFLQLLSFNPINTLCCVAYISAALTAYAVHQFTNILRQQKQDWHERISWFVGSCLLATFIQSLAWSHALLHIKPQAEIFSLLVCVFGWLVLLIERRAQRHTDSNKDLHNESFIGYAGLTLGLIMSFTDPIWRTLCLGMCSIAWFDQARGRHSPMHWWIASMFMGAVFLSVAAIPHLAHDYRALVILLGAALCFLQPTIFSIRNSQIIQAIRGTGVALLVVSVFVASIIHWHLHTSQILTACVIVSAAIICAWQACVADKQRWALLSACMAVLSLPYLGCVDLDERTFYGNHLVAGLSAVAILWAYIGRLPGANCIAQSRSLIGFVLGILACIALILRISIESGRPAEADVFHMALDYGGAIAMTLVLAAVSWWSRSLIPGILSCIIMIILFPELKAQFSDTFETLGWGSGLGGASSGLLLLLSCFIFRKASFLKNLSDGDYAFNKQYFPWRRFDHSLITWPLFGAAVFLTARMDFLTVGRHIYENAGNVGNKTIVAIAITAITWLCVIFYRGPTSKIGHKKFTRICASFLFMWSSTLFIWCIQFKSEIHAIQLISIPLLTMYGFSYVFELTGRWSLINLGLRIRQCLRRLNIPAVGIAVICLTNGINPGDCILLYATASLIALDDCLRQSNKQKGLLRALWFWSIVWSWYIPWSIWQSDSPQIDSWIQMAGTHSWHWMIVAATLCLALQAFFEYKLRNNALTMRMGFFGTSTTIVTTIINSALLLFACSQIYITGSDLSLSICIAVVTLCLAQAYLQSSWSLMSMSILFICIVFNKDTLVQIPQNERIDALFAPVNLFIYASLHTAAVLLVQLISNKKPSLQAQSTCIAPIFDQRLLLGLSILAIGIASIRHLSDSPYHDSFHDIVLSYALLIPLIINGCARYWRLAQFVLVIPLLTAAHIQCISYLDPSWLQHLHGLHLVAIGIAMTALSLSLTQYGMPNMRTAIRWANIILASMVLILLSANYLAHPDLSQVHSVRFLCSAIMAIIAGRALRHLAQGDLIDKQEHNHWQLIGTALYHFSITLAICCSLFLIPALRSPAFALIALSVPALYFYLRAEIERDPSYRHSAMIISATLIFLSVFRSAFLLLLFPDQMHDVAAHDHYHHNAPIMWILGVILLRCTGLGSDRLSALAGGCTIMISSWLLICSFPGLSPFENLMASSLCALLIAHFFTLLTDQRSPVRAGLLRLISCSGDEWHALRQQWGYFLIGACHVITFLALTLAEHQFYGDKNVLLLALASLVLHHGYIRQQTAYYWIAFIEILCALHIGIISPQAWSLDIAAWSLIGLWGILLMLQKGLYPLQNINALSYKAINYASMFSISFLLCLHIYYSGASTLTGIALQSAVLFLAAVSPMGEQRRKTLYVILATAAHLIMCTAINCGYTISSAVPFAVLCICLLFLGTVAEFLSKKEATLHLSHNDISSMQRLINYFKAQGSTFSLTMHSITFGLSLWILTWKCIIPNTAPAFTLASLLIIIGCIQAWSWYQLAQRNERMRYLFFAQIAIGIVAVVIRQLMRDNMEAYRPEYDVWSALLISSLIAAGRQLWEDKARHIHLPLAWSAAILPASTLLWIFYHDLSTDLALIALALHSVGFTYLGRGKKGQAFQAIAVMGFLGLCLLFFWSKLELRMLNAYAIPCGIAVLSLLQLFSNSVQKETRNSIQSVTIVIMLASSAWNALFDQQYPIIYHLCMLGTAIAIMFAGSLLRIRMYMICGFAGLVLAVISLSIHGLFEVDRGLRMSLIGAIILLLGAGLVGGTIFLKAKRDQVIVFVERIKLKLETWN